MLTLTSPSAMFSLSSIFAPIVFAWLDDTAIKMRQWADNALKLDDVCCGILGNCD